MIDKICINFVGGALGHLVLKSIYHHWPQHFGQNTDLIDTVTHANHQVRPTLFLRSYSEISSDEMLSLRHVAAEKNSILLCHNADLIPLDIKKNFAFINIMTDTSSRAKAVFLFMVKSGYSVLEWARKKQKENFDLYEIMFKEFCRMAKEKTQIQPGTNLDFDSLRDYHHTRPALEIVQQTMCLDKCASHQQWYEIHYANSIYPLARYHEIYDCFQRAFESWSFAETDTNYKKTMNSVSDFEHLVDFFLELHGK